MFVCKFLILTAINTQNLTKARFINKFHLFIPMKPGDHVRITTKDSEFVGVLMPNEETDALILKLESGYNIGIEKKKIKKSVILESAKPKTVKEKKDLKKDTRKPTIAVLHTGGTIASKVDYESGAVIAKFSADDLVNMVPELKKVSNINTELVANMMSEDMRFTDHQKIAKCVKKHIDAGVDGVIVGHGTDTLAYTAASLSFMFEKLSVPVLVVGSQRSSDRGSSDAAINLLAAVNFIVKTDYAGVATCLHYTSDDDRCAIISGTKSRKMHSSRRDAFRAINDVPIALVDLAGRVEYLKDYPKKEDVTVLKSKMDGSVALLKTHPNMSHKLFKHYFDNYKGVILEGTGLGQAPTNLGEEHLKIYELLKKYIKKGGIVGITTQCINGRVHPFIYTNCRRLSGIGCVFCEDMIAETALMKLAWLFGNHPAKVKELLNVDIRGEITKRSLPDEFRND